jgi:transcriptional regulator with XRE-family HTH domain
MNETSTIGEKVKALRGQDGVSQEDLANALGMSRSAVSQIENGERNISSNELRQMAKFFRTTADFLLGLENLPEVTLEERDGFRRAEPKEDIRISVPQQKVEKFKQVLLYLLERCAGKPNLGETVLYKLLYFADFNFYEMYEEQLTGATYRKLQYGPVPLEFSAIVDEMQADGQLNIVWDEYYGYQQKRYLPLVKTDLNELRASEKEILDQVIAQLSDRNATWLSEYSHDDVPWKATADKEDIDYELVFYRKPPYSVRDYPREDDEE